MTVMCQCSHNLHEIKERHVADGTSPRQDPPPSPLGNVLCDFLRFLRAEEEVTILNCTINPSFRTPFGSSAF